MAFKRPIFTGLVMSVTLLFTSLAHAFLNIESIRQKAKAGFFGGSGFQLSGESGNTDKIVSSFTTVNGYKTEKMELLGLAKYKYGESANIKDSNEGDLHLRYTFVPSKGPSYEAFGQVEFDEFRNLELRTLLGLGLRNPIIQEEKVSFFIGAGIFFENEDLKDSQDEEDFRGNLYLSFVKEFRDGLEISIIGYYQPSMQRIDDYRVKTDFGFSLKLTEMLSLGIELNISTDSKPPGQVEETDISYLTGIKASY